MSLVFEANWKSVSNVHLSGFCGSRAHGENQAAGRPISVAEGTLTSAAEYKQYNESCQTFYNCICPIEEPTCTPDNDAL